MPVKKRIKTNYPGVYYIETTAIGSNKPDKVYYIFYRKNGKQIEEKVGRQSIDDMTPARASNLRGNKIAGKELPNAEQRAQEILAKQRELDKWTISKLWDQYKLSKPDLKGIVTDQNRFELYILPNFGSKEPSELIALDIHRLRVKLLRKRAPATVKNILELLRRIINFGSKNNLCPGIDFIIEIPKPDNETTEDLTADQLSSLLEAIDNSPDITASSMMLTALNSGMRRGEMFKLKWRDVDFDRGFINLRDPKGKISQKIPLNSPTRKVFESMPRTSIYVFPSTKGKQRTDINKAVNEIKTAAGLPKDFRPLHGLRHVYASMLASSGQVDMYTLQKLLTHKSPQMTQRYAHLRDDALRKASDLAGDIITETIKKKKTVNIK